MKNFWIISLFILPSLLCTFNGNHLAYAAEDELEEEIVDVDNEEIPLTTDYNEDVATSKKSPDANTYLLFTKPLYTSGVQFDLPAGNQVDFLIGFLNKGLNDFVIQSVEASFRYPMDFNYYIQNFSALSYNREVKPNHEATVAYSFLPSDAFAGRPFGLNVALNYRDSNGIQYTEAIFNETVHITEVDEGLDGETFFLYVFLAAIVVLLLVIGQQFLVGSVGKRKRTQTVRKAIETGTSNSNDVDYEWLPQETLKALQKSSPNGKLSSPKGKASAKQSPKQGQAPKPQSPKQQGQSPKQRKVKRTVGSDD